MAVTISAATSRSPGTWGAVEALTQSTATAEQTISIYTEVTTLSGGTATGFTINRYALPAGREGDYKVIWHLATGESYVRFGAAASNLMATNGIHYINIATATGGAISALGVIDGAATGAFVLNSANDFLEARYMNGAWHLRGGAATLATTT